MLSVLSFVTAIVIVSGQQQYADAGKMCFTIARILDILEKIRLIIAVLDKSFFFFFR